MGLIKTMAFKKKNILSLMFDIRPVDKKGNLDLRRVGFKNNKIELKPEKHPDLFLWQAAENLPKANSVLSVPRNEIKKTISHFPTVKTPLKNYSQIFATNKQRDLGQNKFFQKENKNKVQEKVSFREEPVLKNNPFVTFKEKVLTSEHSEYLKLESLPQPSLRSHLSAIGRIVENSLGDKLASWISVRNKIKVRSDYFKKIFYNKFSESRSIFSNLPLKKLVLLPTGIFLAIILTTLGANFLQEALLVKNSAITNGQQAFINLVRAKENLESRNFNTASLNFQQAYAEFSLISKEIDNLGGNLLEATRFVPYLSRISSGSELTKAGENISQAGIIFSDLARNLSRQNNTLNFNQPEISFLEILKDIEVKSQEISVLLEKAQENINRVSVGNLPEDYQEKFLELKDKLPTALSLIRSLKSNEEIFTEILGGNGPRKYLFLFQNNQEMRATGGFIGSYGVLNIFNGRVKNFFIDGIFNPDGQLKEKVIPPMPIQKISASWSLHDSNWFPDFPVSAEKAIWFYEKTGGPTVDGVITMTPSVMQKLLAITGPIEMPEYQITINRDNFLEKVQEEVEVNYDKELNQPKKILADLAPLILDRLFNSQNFSQMGKVFKVIEESVKERQILIYARNYAVEKKISEMGCSGEILKTDKDYLSIINSNINGYKTDGVVEQSVEHEAEIKADGSIQDTVTITRKHTGGNSIYEWWNKVNADYMRVYVPEGSILLSVEGQTREFNSSPLDYKLLGFKQDSQIRQEEDSMEIDQESGTRIYQDAGKTVFANWVYVSPQEESIIKYRYSLPFKIKLEEKNNLPRAYSLLFQKQAGSLEENFSSKIIYPDNFSLSWKYPEDLENKVNENVLIGSIKKIKIDQFIGAAFVKK